LNHAGQSPLANRLNVITPVDEDLAVRFTKIMKVSLLDVMQLGNFTDGLFGKHIQGVDRNTEAKKS